MEEDKGIETAIPEAMPEETEADTAATKENVEGIGEATEGAAGEGTAEEGEAEGATKVEVVGEGGEEAEGEHVEGETAEGEHVEGEHVEGEEKRAIGEGEELIGEGEQVEEEQEKKEEPAPDEELLGEEEVIPEEPPPDPTAPYDFSDSKEALKAPFSLRPDQMAELEQLWQYYQDYNPAYTDIDNYITEVELIYLLKCLNLMTHTPEQMQELIEYCVRPPHPKGHITFDQFVWMVTIRQRDMPIEEELRLALEVMDPEKTGSIDREFLKEVLGKMGHKMPFKHLDTFIKEVDMSNDGTIGIEDVVGTMCIDLNQEDIIMLRNAVYPPEEVAEEQEEQKEN